MKLSELIAAYGDEKIQFQNLDNCATTIDYHHKKGTTIKFGTDAMPGPNGMEKLGIVIWLNRDEVSAILDKSKGGGES